MGSIQWLLKKRASTRGGKRDSTTGRRVQPGRQEKKIQHGGVGGAGGGQQYATSKQETCAEMKKGGEAQSFLNSRCPRKTRAATSEWLGGGGHSEKIKEYQ